MTGWTVHGGRLAQAKAHFGEGDMPWIDLSTGINPQAYPVQAIAPACWNRLPEENDGLEAAAAAYYGNDRLLVLPGSQAAIQGLPLLFQRQFVACVTPMPR